MQSLYDIYLKYKKSKQFFYVSDKIKTSGIEFAEHSHIFIRAITLNVMFSKYRTSTTLIK